MVRQRRSTTLSKGSKEFIMKAQFPDFLPNLVDGVHFRGIGRNVKKGNVFLDVQHFRFMSGSAITSKQNDIVRELVGQFLQKKIHAHRITMGHDKEAGCTSQRLHRSIGVSILPDMVAWHTGAHPFFTPTVFGLVDSSETGLILEHQADFSTIPMAIVDFFP